MITLRVKQIRVSKKMRGSDEVVELSKEEMLAFEAMFKMMTGKPVDFAILLPPDIEAYVFECVETELDGASKK